MAKKVGNTAIPSHSVFESHNRMQFSISLWIPVIMGGNEGWSAIKQKKKKQSDTASTIAYLDRADLCHLHHWPWTFESYEENLPGLLTKKVCLESNLFHIFCCPEVVISGLKVEV